MRAMNLDSLMVHTFVAIHLFERVRSGWTSLTGLQWMKQKLETHDFIDEESDSDPAQCGKESAEGEI